jgi:hypothetical protein
LYTGQPVPGWARQQGAIVRIRIESRASECRLLKRDIFGVCECKSRLDKNTWRSL